MKPAVTAILSILQAQEGELYRHDITLFSDIRNFTQTMYNNICTDAPKHCIPQAEYK